MRAEYGPINHRRVGVAQKMKLKLFVLNLISVINIGLCTYAFLLRSWIVLLLVIAEWIAVYTSISLIGHNN